MATIKAIEGRSVHQIQSGQVIVDLVSVVKELVENSLDAGATSIEIRFRNQGLDSIEVQDNGKGIAPEDFDTIALKHYTSKLSSYEDLTSLETFGFRGEALSSLCALSKFHIVTARAEDGAVGKRLEFEISGKLEDATVAAAPKGTTVSVENLFQNLPVRRKELEKNIKREYGRAISHLYAYACISVGVRFSVSNQMPKGKKVATFSTQANISTKENITNVFGAKTLLALVKLDLHLEMEPSNGPSTQTARNWSTQAADRSMQVRIQGHISKPVFGEGRQAPDRQMLFVNSRPCSLPQVSKAFNEVYKSFNVSQSPFIFANLVMDTNSYDVNVSPDKRTIMLHDQTTLLDRLKSSLTELFEQTDHTVPQSQLAARKLPTYQPLTIQKQASESEPTPAAEDVSDADSQSDDEIPEQRRNASLANGHTTGTPPSLIQYWVGRDSIGRYKSAAPKQPSNGSSRDKQDSINAMLKQGLVDSTGNNEADGVELNVTPSHVRPEVRDAVDRDADDNHIETGDGALPQVDTERGPDPLGTTYDDLFSQRPAQLPIPVQDFNALMERSREERTASASAITAQDLHSNGVDDAKVDSDIPALATSSQKATPGPVQNAFDRMRPKRTPLQTAEITVGDTTTTMTIGSEPPYKRRRIHKPADSHASARSDGSPLVSRGLRTFAAPGSQMEIDSSDVPAINRRPTESSDVESGQSSAEEEDDLPDDDVASGHSDEKSKVVNDHDAPTPDSLEALLPAPVDDDDYDGDYIDEDEKKIREEEKVARLIQEAELVAAQPTEENLRRASQILKNTGNRKNATLQLAQYVQTSLLDIEKQIANRNERLDPEFSHIVGPGDNAVVKDEIDDSNAENRLTLTVSKTDFERMSIIGQFNLGFILAVREASEAHHEEDLFIIDQHAADEKYNYERLQRTVTLQNQRLVRPKQLELTAVEEEIILNNSSALKANGFEIEIEATADESDEPAGRRCRLITLPISGEKTFDLSDLEELLHLLSEASSHGSEIPRPKKVQKILAMRACRSSIMVGKTLTSKQMQKVVRHMGEMEKPWNCPHGRPTMRHLAGLGAWSAWTEGDMMFHDDEGSAAIMEDQRADWKGFLSRRM